MTAHERRMMQEYEDLHKRVEKLRKFVSSDAFRCVTEDEQKLIAKQLSYMQGYKFAIEDRLRIRKLL